MIMKRRTKKEFRKTVFGCLFAIMMLLTGMFGAFTQPNLVYADPENSATERPVQLDESQTTNNNPQPTGNVESEESTGSTQETTTNTQEQQPTNTVSTGDNCQRALGAIGWLVCPTTGKIAEAVDWLYDKIENILVIKPISVENGSPIYEIWKYCRGITNIVFIIFLLIVIYSQLTGYGINNYGIKKVLPKLIVVAVMVNLSFLICSLAVDVSNIVGSSLRGMFTSIQEATVANMVQDGAMSASAKMSYASMYGSLAGGAALAVVGGVIAFETGAIWMLIPVVLGALVAVASGLITIALRQAVVALLIMISPLAVVAYMLPNTDKWYKKWKDLLIKMLVFYPMFSLLFGASSLAGFAIIASAKDGFGVLLGTAVQIFPLFFSWSLMKMSGTFLSNINARLQGLASRPLATNRAWADSRRQLARQKNLAKTRPYTPSLRLMQFVNNRRIAREADLDENAKLARERAMAYRARKHYGRNGAPTKAGEAAYRRQAESMEYQRIIERDRNNMEEGLSQYARKGTAKYARLEKLDIRNINAADMLNVEKARGETITYDNARGFHTRMDDAINAHMDDVHGSDPKYKVHDIKNRDEARARYNAIVDTMNGNLTNIHYAAATAAQGYDTQKKIVDAKMGKYFEMTPPTKDVKVRLDELTTNKDAAVNIDAVISGLRVLNQRGDTDMVGDQIDNILSKEIGGGVKLGTHASQALASFLMFEVKGGDPALRRFGKYINLETARTYNSNDRKEEYVTYDEYLKGYHTEPDGSRMYAKKDSVRLLEGTPLDDIERTALSNLDDKLKKSYGFDSHDTGKAWDIEGYLKRREQIQTAFEPAFLSGSLKWLSGSEQMNSAVKFWTGYEQKQKKETYVENGERKQRLAVDENGNPVYEWVPVWKDKDNGFSGHEDQVEKYYRRKTRDYFNDQTTGQILGMRTDYREPAVEHLINMYMNEEEVSQEERSERQKEFNDRMAEIQTRYGDEPIDKAEKKRKADITSLKREVAGRQLRSILDKSGKLEQIYTIRRSGSANNSKDWLRKMLNLDDKNEIYKYLGNKNRQHATSDQSHETGDAPQSNGNPYNDPIFRTRVMAELNDIFDRTGDQANPDEEFYNRTLEKIVNEFGETSEVVGLYKDYRKNNPQSSRGESWDKLEEILGEFFDKSEK